LIGRLSFYSRSLFGLGCNSRSTVVLFDLGFLRSLAINPRYPRWFRSRTSSNIFKTLRRINRALIPVFPTLRQILRFSEVLWFCLTFTALLVDRKAIWQKRAPTHITRLQCVFVKPFKRLGVVGRQIRRIRAGSLGERATLPGRLFRLLLFPSCNALLLMNWKRFRAELATTNMAHGGEWLDLLTGRLGVRSFRGL
jgi:hypothetical protein